jgi:hypothetical protein
MLGVVAGLTKILEILRAVGRMGLRATDRVLMIEMGLALHQFGAAIPTPIALDDEPDGAQIGCSMGSGDSLIAETRSSVAELRLCLY